MTDAHISVADAFLGVGVDLSDRQQVADFKESIAWAKSRRLREEEDSKNMRRGMWTIIAAAIGAIVVQLGIWVGGIIKAAAALHGGG